jgi:hypothetical protein
MANLGRNELSTSILERMVQARKRREMQKIVSPAFVTLCVIMHAGYSKKVMMAPPLSPEVGENPEE